MTSRADRLLKDLCSADPGTRIRATYELDYKDFRDARIVEVALKNLHDEDPDLQAITIMRLLVRAKERRAFDQSLRILRQATEYDVLSSAIMALANFAVSAPEFRSDVKTALSEISNSAADSDIRELATEHLLELS